MNSFEQYLEFLKNSKINFEAINNLKKMLLDAEYKELKECEKWNLEAYGKYFVTKNDNSIIAFRVGKNTSAPFNLVGSHSDSPTFRIKTNPDISALSTTVLNTEVYGGALLNTWFDRPLSIIGKVAAKGKDALHPEIIQFKSEPGICFIPSVAIHMNRDANKGVEVNPQQHTLPVISDVKDFNLIKYIESKINKKIISHELYLAVDFEPTLVGAEKQYYMSGRIDNLGCAYASCKALVDSTKGDNTSLIYVSDNEEIGSLTRQGAMCPFFRDTLKRIVYSGGGTFDDFRVSLSQSFMISADQAHAAHPNYSSYADPTNKPVINEGVVVKIAANGAYTTDCESFAIFSALAEEANEKIQTFVNRSDKRGGSTIASITTGKLDIPIIDIGNPMWGMHSSVETAGVKDQIAMENIMRIFLSK